MKKYLGVRLDVCWISYTVQSSIRNYIQRCHPSTRAFALWQRILM